MAKRRARKGKTTSVRVSSEAMAAATKISGATGWTQSASLAFVTTAGLAALYSTDAEAKILAARAVLAAAIDVHEAERAAATLVSGHTAKLREARKLLAGAGDVGELPDRPPAPPPAEAPRRVYRGNRVAKRAEQTHPRHRIGAGMAVKAPSVDSEASEAAERPDTPPRA